MALANITSSDKAPAESVHYLFASGEFDLGGKTKKYPTDNADLAREAGTHQWLDVDYGDGENPTFDNAEVQAEAAKYDSKPAEDAVVPETTPDNPVALDAGKPQTVAIVADGDVAETLAADDTSKTAAKTAKDKD